MPTPLIDFTGPIIKAYIAGRNERLKREQFQAERAEKQQAFEQKEKELEVEQKKFEAQLKATTEFHKATLAHQGAQLDLATATAKAQVTHNKFMEINELSRSLAGGQRQWPQEEQTLPLEIQSEFENLFGPGAKYQVPAQQMDTESGGILPLNQRPEVFGPVQVREAMAEQARATSEETTKRGLELTGLQSFFAKQLEDERQQGRLELERLRQVGKGEKKVPEFGENPIGHPEISQFIVGTRTPKSKAEWERYSDAFSRVQWDDGSCGFIPFNAKEFDEMRSAGASKRAVEYAVNYAKALESGNISEAIRLGIEIKKIIPSLKDATNAKALGILSRQDLQMLTANLPNFTTEALSRFFNRKGALNQLKQGWNMQRAHDLANLYKQRVTSLMGNRSAGQKKYYDAQYDLTPELPRDVLKSWGWLKE